MLSAAEPTNIALAQNLLRFECEDVLAQSSYSNRHSSDEVQKLLSRMLPKQKNLLLRRLCLMLLINLYNVFTIGRSTEKVKKLNTFRYNCWVGIFL